MHKLFGVAAIVGVSVGSQAVAAPVNLPGWQSTIKYSTSSAGASGWSNFARATSKVVYDPATGTYTVRDTGSLTTQSTFGPANIDAGASSTNFTVYRKTSGSTVETFRRLNQSPSNTLIALTYVDYGQWRRATTTSGVTSVNDTYLVFGQKTPGGSMPRTGTASYSTVLDGTFVKKSGAYAVSGTGTFNAYLASGTIDYGATLTGTPEAGGAAIDFGTLSGTGGIAFGSSGFAGNGAVNGSGYKLDVNGYFYGPAYQEIGGVFRLTGNGGNGTGAIVGKRP